MRITIGHAEITAPNGEKAYGIDIVGQLGKVGAQGLVEELTRKKESNGYSDEQDRFADAATITRCSEAMGTVLIVHPNSYIHDMTSERVALAVATLVNPVGIHDVVFQPPIPED